MSLRESVLRAMRRYELLPPDGLLVVGVSGGTDSLALLHVLAGLRADLGLRLHVATLDHGVRGTASAADVEFVVATCTAWNIPVTASAVRVKLKAGANLEAALRSVRYHFFAQVAASVGASTVAVAHHADDQAETVLLHILRGAGMRGIRGMLPRAPLPGHPALALIRPLLDVTRAEIESYVGEHNLEPRDDATNRDTRYLRNRLRHEVLPLLIAINPQVKRGLSQLAEISALENDYMEAQLEPVLAEVVVDDFRIQLARDTFVRLHPALQRRFVAWASARLGADDVGYAHLVAAVDLALRGDHGAIALLPGGLQLRLDYALIVVERRNAPPSLPDAPLLNPGEEIAVAVPGITPLGNGWSLEASLVPLLDGIAHVAVSDTEGLRLRTRRRGDRFAPPGLNGHAQRISRWMADRKIAAAVRERIPLLIVGAEIAAIAQLGGWAIAEPYLDRGTGTIIDFRWLRDSELTL